MSNKDRFTHEQLNKMVRDAFNEGPAQGTTAKPNLLELIKSKTGLNKARNERI